MQLSDLEELYLHRQSCRAFDGREVSAELVEKICKAALYLHKSCNISVTQLRCYAKLPQSQCLCGF